MEILIWVGAVITMIGVGLLVYCVWATLAARKNAESPEHLTHALQKLAALNMAALGVSALGLMSVVIGIVLS